MILSLHFLICKTWAVWEITSTYIQSPNKHLLRFLSICVRTLYNKEYLLFVIYVISFPLSLSYPFQFRSFSVEENKSWIALTICYIFPNDSILFLILSTHGQLALQPFPLVSTCSSVYAPAGALLLYLSSWKLFSYEQDPRFP